jgi:purine-binding chemotaxis protein CheW
MRPDEQQRRKELEIKLQGILGQLADVCGELGIDLSPGVRVKPEAAPTPVQVADGEALPALQPGEILLAQIDSLEVGFVSTQVQEIARMVALSPAADRQLELDGYVNVRGQAVPVVNLRHMLGIAPRDPDPEQFLIFLRARRSTLAVVVDEVRDIFDVNAEQIQDRQALDLRRGLLQGVVRIEGRLVGVVDPGRLVAQAL